MLDHAPLAWSRYVVGRRPTSQRRTVVLVLRVRLEGHTDRDLDRSQRDGEVSTHQSSPPRSPRPMTRRRPIWNKLRGSCKQDVSSFTQHHPRPWPCDIGRKASSTVLVGKVRVIMCVLHVSSARARRGANQGRREVTWRMARDTRPGGPGSQGVVRLKRRAKRGGSIQHHERWWLDEWPPGKLL